MNNAYIVAACRTAGGKKGGQLSGWHPADLGGQVIDELVRRCNADPAMIEDVIFGCVGQAGEQSNNVARNAVLASSLPESVPGTSVDRQCGSSQQALHFAAQAVMSGQMDIVIAGGVESMSRVPMGTPSSMARQNGLGHYMSPAMRTRYPGVEFSQFMGAEMLAKKYELTREELDMYALESHRRAAHATGKGFFREEILPVDMRHLDGSLSQGKCEVDEGIRFDASIERIQSVKAIRDGGCITAATSSQICDGASGIMVVSENGLKSLGLEPLARIHHMSVIGHDPVIMLEAPLPATIHALKKAKLSINDVDLFEVNEAFAPVPMAWLKSTGANPDHLNVNGGAIALGHPLGSSGTKLMTTLIYALRRLGRRYGLQTMCEGGGMANVTIIENLA